MKKLFTFLFVFTIAQLNFGQGVFTSSATGNWSALGSWTLNSGIDADGVPDADDNVTINGTHTITVDANSACNDITLLTVNSGTRLAIGGNILEVNGTLNGDGTSLSLTLIATTFPGVLRFVGSSRALIGSNWGANTPELSLEVALNSGQTGTATTAVKAKRFIFTSGIFSTTNEIRPDSNSANTGVVIIQDSATVITTQRFSRTGTANTPFSSLTMNGTGKIIFNGTVVNSLPVVVSGLPVYTYSSGSEIEYQGGTQAIADINYPNLRFSAGIKTWTVGALGRIVNGNINVTGTSLFSLAGGTPITVSGNIIIASTATISHGSSGNRFIAGGGGRTFILNGTARVTANETQTPAATLPFSYQYNNFASYTFAPTSWVLFRSPTSTPVTQGINGITGSSFGNVEIAAITNLSVAGSNTHTFKSNVDIAGILAFPRIAAATNTSLIINFGSFTIKIGGSIQLSGSNANALAGGRTYNSGISSIELNGTTAQNTLGGTDLPSTFYNLKLNNSASVTVANAITVINMLTLAGNSNYTNLSNVTGYTGLEYAATVLQTTGSEFGGSITNLTINNSNGILLDADKTVNGVLTLTNGNLTTSSNTLTIGSSGTISRTSGHIIGSLRKNSFTGSKTFEVGTVNGYTPVDLVATGTGDFTVRTVATSHPNTTGSNVLQMYWTLTNGGLTSADLTFRYLNIDVVGNEFQYELGRYNGTWAFLSPITLDTAANTVSINGINSFSDWTLGESGSLPVELTSFSAATIGSKVKLNWQTATEINNYGFEVERGSHTSTSRSMIEWEKIGFVEGNGNSNSTKNYSYKDNIVTPGKYSYRLKQIDNDGTFEFSNTIEVDLGVPTEFSLSQNYPNPFNPITKIQYTLPIDAQVTLQVYSITGELIESLVSDYQTSGSYTIDFDGSNYASGTYIYRIVANDFVQTKKMIIIK